MTRPTHPFALAALTALAVLTLTSPIHAQGPSPGSGLDSTQGAPSFYEPGISPDGSEIAFVSGGDIWTVPSTGGAARLLVAHSAHESRPLYSPDGRHLAFSSNRNGGEDVFVMDLETGDVRRLTNDSGSEELNGWSRDGEWIYFSSSAEDVAGTHDVFRVRASGGTPMVVAGDTYEGEYFSTPGPDGMLAISTRGDQARGQWWRNGHSHMDESEIWIVEEAETEGGVPTYRSVATGGKNMWPMWLIDDANDDRYIAFMSDRSGAENLWIASLDGSDTMDLEAGEAFQLTEFTEGRVLFPSAAVSASLIAFERDFAIWVIDDVEMVPRRLDITLMGAVEGPTPETSEEDSGWSSIAVSPDGEKWAFVEGGDVWAASTSDDVPATRVTDTPAEEGGIVWTPDSNGIVYASWRTGTEKLYHHDFTTGTERQVTTGDARDGAGDFSPDGRWLAYSRQLHDERELRVIDWESGDDRLLARDIAGGATWSPDSRWVAYGAETDEFTNVKIVSVEGGEPRQASFIASSYFGSPQWSADGTYIVYRTGQRTEPGEMIKVDLVPAPPTFDEDAFRALFEQPDEIRDPDEETEESEDAPGTEPGEPGEPVDVPEEVTIEWDGIRRRGGVVPTGFSVGSILLHPDGESGVVTGEGGMRRVTFGPNGDVDFDDFDAGGSPIAFSENGRQLYTSRGGELRIVSWPGGNERTVSTSVEIVDDFERTKVVAFEQGWGEMRDGFYDPDYHGTDWDAVRETFAPQMAGARTRAEFGRLMDMMLGELNASHLGHSGRTGPPQGGDGHSTGRLGLGFDRIAYENDGRFVVSEVMALGPADVAGDISVGDEVVSIDGTQLDGSSDLHLLLRDTPGEQVVLGVSTGDAEPREVEVLATSGGAESQLRYRNWVESRRAYVGEISDGRLGYVHIPSMSQGSLTQFIRDLDQLNHAKDGVVIDVRDNNGGFVNVYAIDVLARQNYLTMESRGSDVRAPARVRLGQRALLAPTVLVTNQNTLSDGEDFTEGYRELGLGSVVGEPTAGWIIFTGSRGLVDGTSVRMPGTYVRDNRGQNMELNPRPVDVEVERPAGESYLGIDSQLDAAVRTLLDQIDGG
ncbi:MAG TPA: S41 family peptidase [Longimicrobiales bacterium]|nr:S41 family peptidase [Longimicrobiales bacterium]